MSERNSIEFDLFELRELSNIDDKLEMIDGMLQQLERHEFKTMFDDVSPVVTIDDTDLLSLREAHDTLSLLRQKT